MISKIVEGFEVEEKKVIKALFIGLIASLYLLYKNNFSFRRLMNSLADIGGSLATSFKEKMMLGRWAPRTAEQEEIVLKRGGYVGGLMNDGNTCFMNSVLQSLASSKELLKFMDEHIINVQSEDENGDEAAEAGDSNTRLDLSESSISEKAVPNAAAKIVKSKSKLYGKRKKIASREADAKLLKQADEPNIQFTVALDDLLSKLNAKHYRNRPWFKTNKLLKTMSKAPNKNIILGYDQEDAQEFFQTILSELEKNVESIYGKPAKDVKPIPENELPADAIIGQSRLGEIGTVYIPTEQIDPNSVIDSDEKFYSPFKIITPLDGISAERIGCLQCGENGGIRYSVFSGLSLNLPSDNIGSPIKLSELLQEWNKPEIIEGVECNRCALNAVHAHLNEQLNTIKSQDTANEKLITLLENRIKDVEAVLAKPAIDDADYKKMHTENMVRKSSKSKQILISRPPPLLSIHINRSVFDPRTYMIRKNNSRVLFRSRLNLSPWCCDYDEINLDARLPMSKKQEQLHESSEDDNAGGEYYNKLHRRFEREFEDSDEEEEDPDEQEILPSNPTIPDYDPLDGELHSSSFSSEEEEMDDVEEVEIDALGNTIVKRTSKEPMLGGSVDNQDSVTDEEVEDELDELDDEDVVDNTSADNESLPSLPIPTAEPIVSKVPAGPLTYVLRSVIVHYGTHNYGHYIAFRKFRGCWWRISDESVYIVDEAEVLSTPGVFMLFYEYDYNETAGKMNEDLELENEFKVEIDEANPDVSEVQTQPSNEETKQPEEQSENPIDLQ